MKIPRIVSPSWLCCTLILAALGLAPSVRAADGDWETLFDGKTLNGWKAAEHPASFSVVDDTIRGSGLRSHLFYQGSDGKAEFENFELELEFKAVNRANSGVYFHATWQDEGWPRQSGTEVQVNNDQPAFEKNYIENKKTGSLYGFRNLYKAMARDDEWFTLNIRVTKPRAQVRINGRLMIDYVEPTNVPVLVAGATRDQLTQGTFALQCHDEKSEIFFRNIRVRRLPGGTDATVARATYNDQDRQRQILARDNFPLLNLRTRLSGTFTLDDVQALRNRTGIFAGIVYFASDKSPLRDDAAALATIDAMKDVPAFIGLETDLAGPLSSIKRLKPETLARFDFITSSKTFDLINVRGKEAEPDSMDTYVACIAQTIEESPIDVFANVMVLPKGFYSSTEELWTEERMQRVIAAAKKNGVAFEINPRERTPSEKFITLAKAAGVRFTIGGDGTTAENYADWPYLLEMQQKAKLVWRDMYVPGHDPTRAQRALLKK